VTPSTSGKQASTELPNERAREIWQVFVDPVLDLLKSHVQANYAEHGLKPAQACMLQELKQPMSQHEAALRLGYDPSNITALADSLEAKGLVERRLDPSDRRVKTLARTPDGERLARDLDDSLSQPPASLSRLTLHDQEQLLRLLNKVFGPSA
jgi:DNA-binding MarR family transcriptional regulator